MTVDFLNQIKSIALTYTTDTIYVLGKGPSIDQVAPDVYASSLVIALNDAERIAPADITIFHSDWVKEGIAESGNRSRMYITSTDFSPKDRVVVRVPYKPLTQESSDVMMQRFMTDELVIDDVIFLLALKVARIISDIKGRDQTVYMVGFDFDAERGYSKLLGHDYAPQRADERAIKISTQEFFFLNTLYFLRKSNLNVLHVGNRPFSSIAPEDLNKIGRRCIPGGGELPLNHSVKVVAELTTNHFGDRLRLERMIRASHSAGADFIKLQKRDVDTFYSKEQLASKYVSPFGDTFGDYRRQLELSADDFNFVDRLCSDLGISWFASILDEPSFRFMLQFDPKLVKLPSTISEHTDYLRYVADNYSGSVVLSTGMTDESYEEFVLSTFNKCESLFLLQCNSAYPTPLEDCGVGIVRRYNAIARSEPRIIPGYSSHDFGWKASALAVAAGAKMVEKHVKLGNTEWAHFDAVAVDLTTPAFKEYVDAIREAEMIVGPETKQVRKSEHHKYRRATEG